MCEAGNTSARTLRLLLVLTVAAAVPAAPQAPSFETVSVKVNRSGFPGGLMDFRAGGQFSATNETLLQLVRAAYDVTVNRITGGPDWLGRERFDVEARAGAGVPIEQSRLMLRAMLADRFKLRARIDTREMPTFTLVLSRQDGATGPRLRPASPPACVNRGPMPGRTAAGELPSCGLLPSGPERMSGRSVTLDRLLQQLSSMTGRVINDRTGLTGTFDIDLEWAMTEAQVAQLAVLTPPGGTPPVFDPNRPGLFTALDEQLGLKLEPGIGPVNVVVIESAERPSEN
jgi:uncharacterized protein (TIGR03435 family)